MAETKTFNTKYLIIEPDAKVEDWEKVFADQKDIEFDQRRPGYNSLVEKIETPFFPRANFEHVYVNSYLTKDGVADMFVDDVGRLKDLPRNPIATAIYWTATKAHALPKKPDQSTNDMLKEAFLLCLADVIEGKRPNDADIRGRAIVTLDKVWF
jgi:hypothetical protein